MLFTTNQSVQDIQAYIDNNHNCKIVFEEGEYIFTEPLRVPNHKVVEIAGSPGTILKLDGGNVGDGTIMLCDRGDKKKYRGMIYIHDMEIISIADGQSAIGVEQGEQVRHGRIIFERLRLDAEDYDIRLDNMGYSVSPRFVDITGHNGIYWAGAVHSASNLRIEGCRFHNSRRGPSIYISGARSWQLENNITEGSSVFDEDIDKNSLDVMNTRGILIRNPGPNGSYIKNHWSEWWGMEDDEFHITILYEFNNGGSNRCGTYTIENSSSDGLQFLNYGKHAAMVVYIKNEGWNIHNPDEIVTDGEVRVFIEGGELSRDYSRQKDNVKVTNSVIGLPADDYTMYSDKPQKFYAYKGGTGIYKRDILSPNQTKGFAYVQNHPKYGPTLLIKRQDSDTLNFGSVNNKCLLFYLEKNVNLFMSLILICFLLLKLSLMVEILLMEE